MLTAAGMLGVLVAVLGGFLLEGGNHWVLVQPGELLIVGRAAGGWFVIASSPKLMRRSLREMAFFLLMWLLVMLEPDQRNRLAGPAHPALPAP